MLTAKVEKVKFGSFEIEGFLAEDGNYYVSFPQLVQTSLIPPNRSCKQLEDLLGIELQPVKLKTKLNPKAVNAINLNKYEALVFNLALGGKEAALRIARESGKLPTDLYINEKKEKKQSIKKKAKVRREYVRNSERAVQLRLAKHLKGKCEVETPVGRIDVLTDSEIIEVKTARGWKSALGQVLAYSDYYPNHNKRVHLFGKLEQGYLSKNLSKITETCLRQGVIVTFE